MPAKIAAKKVAKKVTKLSAATAQETLNRLADKSVKIAEKLQKEEANVKEAAGSITDGSCGMGVTDKSPEVIAYEQGRIHGKLEAPAFRELEDLRITRKELNWVNQELSDLRHRLLETEKRQELLILAEKRCCIKLDETISRALNDN